jgi:hypothetical protein
MVLPVRLLPAFGSEGAQTRALVSGDERLQVDGQKANARDLRKLLSEYVDLSSSELAAVDVEPVVKEVTVANDKREAAVVGIMRIPVPQEFFVNRFRQFPEADRGLR